MNIKQNYKKIIGTSLLINLIVISLSIIIVSSQLSGIFTISSGIYPSANSYTIWQEGLIYYAKNAFGVIDYSGLNSTIVLTNAINNLNIEGGSIFLKAGEYDRIIINRNYITLMGEGFGFSTGANAQNEGSGITKIKSTTAEHLIYINSTDGTKLQGIVIKYLYLYGNGTTNGYSGIYAENIDQPVFEHIEIHNVENGFYLQDCDAFHVYKNTVLHSGNGIKVLGSGSSYGKIVMNELSDNLAYGVRLSSGTWGTRVALNTLARNDNTAISVSGSEHNEILGNILRTNRNGISLTATSTKNTVSNNVIQDSNKTGIWLSASENNTISLNQVWNNGLETSSTYSGIVLTNSDWNTIMGNIASDDWLTTQEWGIEEEGTSDYNIFIGNIALDNAVGGIKTVGVNTQVNLCWNGTTWIS